MSPRRLSLLSAYAAAIGLVAGGAAWVLVHLIGLLTNLALFHRWSWALPSLREHPPGAIVLPAAIIGSAIVVALAAWVPIIRGHGIPETMEAVLERQSRIAPSAAIAKPLSAAVAIGTGGPFGAEGPIIVTGGAIGSLLGQVTRVSASERKTLLACGAAAGMTATFGSPLAAVVLAIELLLFEFSTRTLVPLVVATSVAGGVHAALFESGPLFTAPTPRFEGLAHLPVFAVLGVACGLLAVVICKGLTLVEDGYRRLPIADHWHPILGGVGFAVVGLVVPGALGVGYDSIDATLTDRLALGTAAALLLAKLVAWWLALGSGTSGGTLAPILLVSGCFGLLFGHASGSLGTAIAVGAGSAALVAMAATFGAATRAPFTAIVFAFELTRDYRAILPLMLATAVAHLVSSALLDHGLMTEKLARRGLLLPSRFEPDVLATTSVARVMSAPVESLAAGATVGEARQRFAEGRHSAYPLLDEDGRCVGVVTRTDVFSPSVDDDEPVVAVAATEPVAARPDEDLRRALERIVDRDVSHLPVLDDEGRCIGILTRTDLLRVPRTRLRLEQPEEPGWRRVRNGAPGAAPGTGRASA